ncbi:cytochrome P460 family protein [Ancylobacter sp. A5.8]|uniref:cytochrome P460 family protein n=1 Tax=Ancylobacter gelatini TaxID=2919920 RepID=UPI001F4DAFE6|nr:cytochrome P460 family protein [Ancylobacter gelatini]MCJ8145096.1 cytochrome P460 family protein [Ancylobacter gelatini]
MKYSVTIAAIVAAVSAITTGVIAQTANTDVRTQYKPEYTASGELVLPKNFEKWVFVGSPLTPNALNDGEANFPEYHNVYMDPVSYETYQKTNVFPEGTTFFKELQLALPAENPDGSRTEPSGRGYFPGALNGADVTVKDSKRFAETGGWGYFNFNHHEPKAPTAKARPIGECAYCHMASAKKDDVWTQFYPRLDH